MIEYVITKTRPKFTTETQDTYKHGKQSSNVAGSNLSGKESASNYNIS